MISQKTIQSIQSVMRIEEVIADFLPLRRKGKSLWACCPFHQEHTPSFCVSPIKGFYKCFGCDSSGDAITFIQQIENVSFIEAIAYLAQKYGIPVEEVQEEKEGLFRLDGEKENLYRLLNLARDYYVDLLWKHPEAAKKALPYLAQRAIPFEIAKKFGLGYSLESWDGFLKFALQQGIGIETVVSAGLVVRNESKTYDRFRGRLMFPIHNNSGQVIAFAARHMGEERVDVPKYINSPETVIYQKGTLLYGLYFAKKSIKQENNCYLVEGYTDALAFHKVGVACVVASAGTALTEAQINYLCRFTPKITLVFDGDAPGIRAAFRGIDKLLAKGLEVSVLILPSGEDPDSYICTVGKEAFIHYLQQSTQDFITFKASFLLGKKEVLSPTYQSQCIREIVQSIAIIPDEIEQHLFLKKCSTLFSIEEEVLLPAYYAIRDQFKADRLRGEKRGVNTLGMRKSRPPVNLKGIPFTNPLTVSIEAYEREIMRILLSYGAMVIEETKRLDEYLFLELENMHFKSTKCKMLLDFCKNAFQNGCVINLQYCLENSSEEIKKIAIDMVASVHEISEAWIKKYGIYTTKETNYVYKISREVILRLKIRLIQELIEQNREALKKVACQEEERDLLEVHQLLKSSECDIAKQLGIVVAQY